jgi:hypothetical protein
VRALARIQEYAVNTALINCATEQRSIAFKAPIAPPNSTI